METIRYRITRGDNSFSRRILLTALIKGDKKTVVWILNHVDPENDFGSPSTRLIFDGIAETITATGQANIAHIYQKTELYVQTEVVASQIAFIDRLFAEPLPSSKDIDWAITRIRQEDESDDPILGERYYEATWIAMIALLKGDRPTQKRILNRLQADDFDTNLDNLFIWVGELLPIEGEVKPESLYRQAKAYVIDKVMVTYTAPIDHLLAIDLPDKTMIAQAMASLKRYRTFQLQNMA